MSYIQGSTAMQICPKCKELRAPNQFSFTARRKNRQSWWCKICQANYAKQVREQQKSRHEEAVKKWEKERDEHN